MAARRMNLAAIRVDGGTQARVGINENTVSEYAEALGEEGSDLPPVVVFNDGVDCWLGDGFHRHRAYTRAGRASIPADVRAGTQRDAILHACGANTQHGLRRTNEDKRRAVGILLADPEWSQWSDREIARRCSVGHPLVADVRAHLEVLPDSQPAGAKRFVERGGTTYEQDTTNIGKGSTAKGGGTIAEPSPPAGNVATPPPAGPRPPPSGDGDPPAPAGDAGAEGAEEDDGPTLAEIAEELQAENAELHKQIEAMKADDQKAETLKWRISYEMARKAKDELQQRVVDREAELKRHVNTLRRIGRAVGEDDPTKVAATVELFVRNAQVAA